VEAGLVTRAELWPWSSLGSQYNPTASRIDLDPAPVPLPAAWLSEVNAAEMEEEMFDQAPPSIEP
jgi:hypothetical protein